MIFAAQLLSSSARRATARAVVLEPLPHSLSNRRAIAAPDADLIVVVVVLRYGPQEAVIGCPFQLAGIAHGEPIAYFAFQGEAQAVVHFDGVVRIGAALAGAVEITAQPARAQVFIAVAARMPDIHRPEMGAVGVWVSYAVYYR